LKWQEERGETEGRKTRSVCLVLAIPREKRTHLILLAISGTPPQAEQTTIAISALERCRAGLKDWKEAWITVSEYNYDVAEGSFYYEPNGEILGQFSPSFLGTVASAIRPSLLVLKHALIAPEIQFYVLIRLFVVAATAH